MMARNHCERDPCCDGFDTVVRVPERDHNKLENRDMEDQHPIKAITNLSQELTNLSQDIAHTLSAENAMTNMEILEIIGG